MIPGAELVGGQKMLELRLADWGYLERAADLPSAVALWQSTYQVELDQHSFELHHREGHPDGEIGPASARIFNGRFCNVPDFRGAEEARWPDTCAGDITVSWNFEQLPGASAADTREAWDWCVNMYNRLFEVQQKIDRAKFPNTRIWATLKPLPGGTLAWSFLPTGNCAFRCEQAYDSTQNWSSQVLRRGTVSHEVGHAMGMEHTPNDPRSLMYPSMNGQSELNQTDINQMLRLGYKRRTTPVPDPPTDPPLPPGDVRVIDGTIRISVGNVTKNQYWRAR